MLLSCEFVERSGWSHRIEGQTSIGRNLARLMFDPNGAQPFLANFDVVRRQLLWRIQREVLSDPDAERNAGSPR